ncbi:MAG: inorganic triphosphatase [Oceanobacter sp.]
MAYEIELKLRYDAIHHDHLAQVLSSRAESKDSRQLQNRYYDTPDGQLIWSGCALRLRRKGEEWEQTLKARGQSEGGLFKRLEWNWPVDQGALKADYLAAEEVASVFPSSVSVDDLSCQFETNFFRQVWHWRLGDTLVEAVLDRGEVSIPGTDKTVPLCEMELELLEGETRMLWWMAESLCSQVPLWVSDVSKAERGYRLAGLQSEQTHQVEPIADALPLVQSINQAMGRFKRSLESAIWEADVDASMAAAQQWLAILQLSEQKPDLRSSMPRQHLIGPFTELASIAAVQKMQALANASNEPDFRHPAAFATAAKQWRQQPSFAQQCLLVSKWSWQQLQEESTAAESFQQQLQAQIPKLGLDGWLNEPRNLVLLMMIFPATSELGTMVRELAASCWLAWGLQHHAVLTKGVAIDQQIELNQAKLGKQKRLLIQALLKPDLH